MKSNSVNQQLAKRAQTRLSQLFDNKIANSNILVLTSSDDQGVIRNGGRNGARYAPKAILNSLKGLTQNQETSTWKFSEAECAKGFDFKKDFTNAQHQSIEKTKNSLKGFKGKKIVHLGGGHDHIYPLLGSLGNIPIGVINIDAHLDTRTDSLTHSGTPFRQFANEHKNKFHLIQMGIHPYANTQSSYQPLGNNGQMDILDKKQIPELKTLLEKSDPKMQWVFSLDCDGLHSSIMEAVSAVNHRGIKESEFIDIFNTYLNYTNNHKQLFGIYEYNPIYDNLSQKGARFLSDIIYQFLTQSKREE